MVGTNNYKRVIGMTFAVFFLFLSHSLALAGEVVASLTFSKKNFNIYKTEWKWKGKFWQMVKWENPQLIEVKPAKPKGVSNFLQVGLEPGEPALPYMITPVAMPWGSRVTNVKILSKDSLVLPGQYNIMPLYLSTKRIPKSIIPETGPDSAVYASDSSYPGILVEFLEEYETGGPCVAWFYVYPLHYVPAQGKLILYTRIEFRVTYAPKEDVESLPRFIDTEKLESIKGRVINPGDVHI